MTFTVESFKQRKSERQKIAMLTAYDYHSALICDQSGIDAILVGDSLGFMVQGSPDARSVTVTEMMYHTGIVSRGVQRACVISDMPFGSYENNAEAVKNAQTLIERGNAQAVQMEGRKIGSQIKAVVQSGIPVMGLIGMDPEVITRIGPYVNNSSRPKNEYEEIIQDALELEKAGCFALILRTLPSNLARRLTMTLKIPVLGLGSGRHVDGQILLYHDMMGITDDFRAKHVKRYAHVSQVMLQGVRAFVNDVEKGLYPNEEFEY